MPLEIGKVVEGKVSGITSFGAFIQLPGGRTGLVHISEVAEEYVKDINNHLKENQKVKVKVLSIDEKGKISLSIKKAVDEAQQGQQGQLAQKTVRPGEFEWSPGSGYDRLSFEDRMSKFLKDSEDKMHDLKKNFEAKRGAGSYKKSGVF